MEFLKSAAKSKTMAFAGSVVALGIADQYADVIPLLVPDEYRGIAVAAVGLVIAVLRQVTTKPLSEK